MRCARARSQIGITKNALIAMSKDLAAAVEPGHICEVAEILSLALMRVRARKSSRIPASGEESSLHILPAKSGHLDLVTGRGSDD